MTTDLKTQNNLKISALLAAAILICAGFQRGFDSVPTLQQGLFTGTAGIIFSAVLVLITNLLPHNIKHKLVFLRLVDEMPKRATP